MKFIRVFIALLIMSTISIFFSWDKAEAADNAYDVSSTVRNNWSNTLGGKTFDQTSGRKLVYDVYSNKFTSNGYRIVNANHGKGTEPFVNFQGWAVLHGHTRHTSSNHETFIVARKTGGDSGIGTTRVYGTVPYRNLSATEDLEYNNQGPNHIYNECPSGAKNRANTDCNFRYDNVGFNAFLPLRELFSNTTEEATWTLFIVKRVDSQIVYAPLNLPFEFSNTNYESGQISLSSGINASILRMSEDSVLRRTSPRQPASQVTGRYFTRNSNYTRIDSDETETAVWYGVRTPEDSNSKRWANTAYWSFGGDQASLKFIPEKNPPEHRQHGITDHRYQNGNDYWAQPDDKVKIRLRGFDNDSLLERTSMMLDGSALARVRHNYNNGNNNYDYYTQTSHINVFSGQRTFESDTKKTREATFQLSSKTHGHTYNISAWQQDNVGNNTGWVDTKLRLRIDGVAPTHVSNSVIGARYINGADYWVRPNDKLNIRLRQNDPHSGNRIQYLRLLGSGQDVRSLHSFHNSETYNERFRLSDNDRVSIDNALRAENSTNGRVLWGVTPKTHGHIYDIMYYFEDNARNTSSDYESANKRIRVDGVAPINVSESISNFKYQDGTDYWIKPNDVVEIKLRGRDLDSGLNNTMLSTGSGSNRNITKHEWDGSTTNLTSSSSSDDFTVTAANRTYSSGNIREVTFSVRGNTHGANHGIRHRYEDNVGNLSEGDSYGWSSSTNNIRVDGIDPTASFSNTSGTTIRITPSDIGSGVKRFRYQTSTNNGSNYGNWSSWLTNTSFDIVLGHQGDHRIRVELEDNVGNKNTVTSNSYRFNRPPVADYTFSPATIYNNTTVTFTNSSTDPDGDLLTYQWAYQEPNSSTWVNFSTATNPTRVLGKKGTWNIRLTAFDGEFTDSIIKAVTVQNRPPQADFELDKGIYYVGDTAQITDNSYDEDGDTFTNEYTILHPNGSTEVITTKDFTHTFDSVGNYQITLKVEDTSGGIGTITKIITIYELSLKGYANHTIEWEKIHQEKGNLSHQFYSGETILVVADITEHPASYVEVTLNGRLVNGNLYSKTISLAKQSDSNYIGVFDGEPFIEDFPLKQGIVSLEFEVKYLNGQIRNDTVNIEILDNVLSVYKLHRVY